MSPIQNARWGTCGHYARHWFTAYRLVGIRRPDCVRCGAPNPVPLTADQQANFDHVVELGATRPAGPVEP